MSQYTHYGLVDESKGSKVTGMCPRGLVDQPEFLANSIVKSAD